jgi:hypothetical protein
MDTSTEQLVPGLIQYWLMDRQIVVYKASAVSRLAVDTWVASVKEVMRNWPADRPYLALHEFTDKHIMLTPYARKRAEELSREPLHVPGYAAIILPQSFAAQLIRLFLRAQRFRGVENQAFFSVDGGLAWLKTKVGELARAVK